MLLLTRQKSYSALDPAGWGLLKMFPVIFWIKGGQSYLCTPFLKGPVVQLVRMPACHAGGRGFESRPVREKKPFESIFKGLFV
jgi:hypothetical protein